MPTPEDGIQLVLHATATASNMSTTEDTLALLSEGIYHVNPALQRPLTVHDIMSFSTSMGSGSISRSAPTEPRLSTADVAATQTSVCRESIVRECAARMNSNKNIDVKNFATTARQMNLNKNPFSNYTPSSLRRFICCTFNGVVVPTPEGPSPTVTLYRSPWSNQYQTIYNQEDIMCHDLIEDGELGQHCLQEAQELFSLKGLSVHKQNLESTSGTGSIERQTKSRDLEIDLNMIFNDYIDAYYRSASEIEPEVTMRDFDADGTPVDLQPLDHYVSKESIHKRQAEAMRMAAMPDRLRRELQEYQANTAEEGRGRQAPVTGERDHNCLASVFVRDFAIERERKDDAIGGDIDGSEQHKQYILEVIVVIHNESKEFGGTEKRRRWTTVHIAHIWQVDVLLKLTMISRLFIAVDGAYGDHVMPRELGGEQLGIGDMEDDNGCEDDEINNLLSSLGPVPSARGNDVEEGEEECSNGNRNSSAVGSANKKNAFISSVSHDSIILSSPQDALIVNTGVIKELVGNAVQSIENEEFLSAIDGVIGPSAMAFLKRRLVSTDILKDMMTGGTTFPTNGSANTTHSSTSVIASHNNHVDTRESMVNELKQFLSSRENAKHV